MTSATPRGGDQGGGDRQGSTRPRKPVARVAPVASAPTSRGPPASPSSRPISAAPMVWPSRSGGLTAARAAKANGVIKPVPTPMRTAAPSSPGSWGTSAGTLRPWRRDEAQGDAGAIGQAPGVSGPSDHGWLSAAVGRGSTRCSGGHRAQAGPVAEDGEEADPQARAAVLAARAAVGIRNARSLSLTFNLWRR